MANYFGSFSNSTFNGNNQKLSGNNSCFMGDNLTITGNNNKIIGNNAKVIGNNNHVVGNNAKVIGNNNHVVGNNAKMNGANNHAVGNNARISTLCASSSIFDKGITISRGGVIDSLSGSATINITEDGNVSISKDGSQIAIGSNISQSSPSSSSSTSKADDRLRKMLKRASKHSSQVAIGSNISQSSSSSSASSPPPKSLKRPRSPIESISGLIDELDKLQERDRLIPEEDEDNNEYKEKECDICCERLKCLVFKTCGHVSTCVKCAIKMEKNNSIECPLCKAKSDSVIFVYI